MSLIQNANLTINVGDLDLSIDFYQRLGCQLTQRWGSHYAQLKAPGLTIGLHPTNQKDPHKNSGNVSIGFTATDWDEVKSKFERENIHFVGREEEGGEFIHFTDLDGTSLYFINPKW